MAATQVRVLPQPIFRWARQAALMGTLRYLGTERVCRTPHEGVLADPPADGAVMRASSEVGKEPSVYRPLREGRLQVRFAGCPDSRAWIKDVCGSRTRPEWSPEHKVWLVARTHLHTMVSGLLERFGLPVHVFVEFRADEHFEPTNQDVTGSECTCSCPGAHHETAVSCSSRSGWVQVGAATTIHHGDGVRRHFVAYPRSRLESRNGITRR